MEKLWLVKQQNVVITAILAIFFENQTVRPKFSPTEQPQNS